MGGSISAGTVAQFVRNNQWEYYKERFSDFYFTTIFS